MVWIRMIQMIYDNIVNENLCQTVLSTWMSKYLTVLNGELPGEKQKTQTYHMYAWLWKKDRMWTFVVNSHTPMLETARKLAETSKHDQQNQAKQPNGMDGSDFFSSDLFWLDKVPKIFLSNGGWFNGDQSHGIKSAKISSWAACLPVECVKVGIGPLVKNEYPPGNDHISHLGKRKMIDSTVPNGRGYVSDIRSMDGRLFGSTVKWGGGWIQQNHHEKQILVGWLGCWVNLVNG